MLTRRAHRQRVSSSLTLQLECNLARTRLRSSAKARSTMGIRLLDTMVGDNESDIRGRRDSLDRAEAL